MKKKTYVWFIVVAFVVVGGIFLLSSRGSSFETLGNFEGEMTIYKSSSCGCCGIYGGYFNREGNGNVEIKNMENIDGIKAQYGVPLALQSCHTTIVGDYFVEGHIPLEAVERLLTEKPDIKGIAMPGMPSGSPGMPGAKIGDFVIYAVNHDGSYDEWMRL